MNSISVSHVRAALLNILTNALLSIRLLGWSGNPERCAIEADHVHNIPYLVAYFSIELLESYWEVDRLCYINKSTEEDMEMYKNDWNILDAFLKNEHLSSKV